MGLKAVVHSRVGEDRITVKKLAKLARTESRNQNEVGIMV
jgi:hypothetical protein